MPPKRECFGGFLIKMTRKGRYPVLKRMNGIGNVEKIIGEYLREYKINKDFIKYEDGYMVNACMQLHQATEEARYLNFLMDYVKEFVGEDGSIQYFDSSKLNKDSINAFKVLLYIYDVSQEEKYFKAIEDLQQGIRNLPRDEKGIFLAGENGIADSKGKTFYELLPFYMEYETRFHKKAEYNDIVMQCQSMKEEEKDEWYLLALVDIMEAMSIEIFEHYKTLEQLFKDKVRKMLSTKEVNVEEETGSTFRIAYAIIKACRIGALSREKYEAAGLGILEGGIQKVLSLSGEENSLSEKTVSIKPECMGSLMMAYAQKLMLQKQ